MSNESLDNAIQSVANIDVTELEVRDIERLKNSLERKKQELIKSKPPSGKPYIPQQQGYSGVLYLLENEVTVKQVWEWLKVTYNHKDEWIQQAKKLEFFYSKQVYLSLKDHSLIKQMRKDKLIRQTTFTSSSSYNNLLTKVSVAKNILVAKNKDKQTIQEYEALINGLSERVLILEDKVEMLEATSDYLMVDRRMEVKLLSDNGVSQKDLAVRYGVTTRTIRYWLKG